MIKYVAILHMEKPELNLEFRAAHLEYLKELEQQGKIFAKGPFTDGTGGMVIYLADSFKEAQELAGQDPYVIQGVRRLELHEWKTT